MRPAGYPRRPYILSGLLLLAAVTAAQGVGYKDLTNEQPNPIIHRRLLAAASCAGEFVGGGGSFALACPPATYPFRLSLVSVDQTEFPIGGQTTVLLRLENVGHDSAFVPWTTDSDVFERPDGTGTYLHVDVDVVASLVEETGNAYFRIPVHLYGAEVVPGSLWKLSPGEWVEVKLKLALNCKEENFHCTLLRPGPAKLSITWTESQRTETYGECSIHGASTRLRMLTSDSLAVEVLRGAPQ